MLSKRVCANTRLSRSPSHSIRPPARSASAGRVRVTNWNARTSAWRESSPAIDLSLRLPKPAISTGHHHGSLRSACGDLSGRPNLTRTVRARFRRRTSLSRRSAMMLPSLLGRHTLSSSIRLTKVGQRRRGRRRIPEDSPNRGAPGVLCTHVVRHDALQVVSMDNLGQEVPIVRTMVPTIGHSQPTPRITNPRRVMPNTNSQKVTGRVARSTCPSSTSYSVPLRTAIAAYARKPPPMSVAMTRSPS